VAPKGCTALSGPVGHSYQSQDLAAGFLGHTAWHTLRGLPHGTVYLFVMLLIYS